MRPDPKYGRTPLSWAARRGNDAVVNLLIEKGAHVDSKDTDDWTPLLWAAQSGNEAVVRLLLGKGADVDLKDPKYGRTPLSWPQERGTRAW